MTSESFTPGPWHTESDPAHYDTISTVFGGQAGKQFPGQQLLVQVGGFAGVEEQEANTRLISAAPELHYELAQARNDVMVLLALLDGVFETDAAPDDADDLSILSEIKAGYATSSAALAKVSPQAEVK